MPYPRGKIIPVKRLSHDFGTFSGVSAALGNNRLRSTAHAVEYVDAAEPNTCLLVFEDANGLI